MFGELAFGLMKLVRENQRGEDVCRDLAKAWCLLRVSLRHVELLTFLSCRSVPRSGLLTRINNREDRGVPASHRLAQPQDCCSNQSALI